MGSFFHAFVPKSIVCWREGYSFRDFFHDLKAGVTVGIIALPLAMAFAIGSGVAPERGLYTAIVAGFLISLFGGSRVQIGGPTGAYVVLLYAIVQKHGYDGLQLATLMAGLFLILMGILRLGVLIRYIPHPVIIGFTTGIATLVFTVQIKDFFGLSIPDPSSEFFVRLKQYWQASDTIEPFCTFLSVLTIAIILFFRKLSKKIPGAIIAVLLATIICFFFDLPIQTIQSKFGDIPQSLPHFDIPAVSFTRLWEMTPDACAVALLGAIESLLSCVIADSMIGSRHKSNCELVGQGIANIGSSFVGGIAATGAIARTTANIQMGAKTPMAGMIHAATLLGLMLVCARFTALMPLGAMAAVLMVVAYNMCEFEQIKSILKGPKSDRCVLIITYLLTVCIDLTFAVQIGVLLSAILFMKKMSDKARFKMYQLLDDVDAEVVEIEGPLFFGATNLLHEALTSKQPHPKRIILRLNQVPFVDASGLHALKQFEAKCQKLGIEVRYADVRQELQPTLYKAGLLS